MNLLLAEPHRAQPPAAARRNGAIFWANHGEACSNRSSSLRVRHVPVRALARRQGADRLNVTTCSSYQPAARRGLLVWLSPLALAFPFAVNDRNACWMATWSVATPPASYGEVDDGLLVRHVSVSASASLTDIKKAILKAYEDQYEPSQITLFTRKYDDEPTRVTTDRAAKLKLLSYAPDWAILAPDAAHASSVLLCVSAMDDSERSLLVLPAAHSPSAAMLDDGLASARTATMPQALAEPQLGLFDPLPLPAHVDDWLAQYREAPQSVSDLISGPHARRIPGRETIYLQPIRCLVAPGEKPAEQDAYAREDQLFASLRAYLAAFYQGTAVGILPPVTVRIDLAKGRGTLLGKTVRWRDYCPGNGQPMPHGQLDAGMVLAALKPRITKGGICKGTGALPADGHCVLGVTMCDFFCDDDDVFTSGLACLTSRAGAFSFYRYGEATGGAMGRGVAVASIGGGKKADKQAGKGGNATSASVGAAAAASAAEEHGVLLFRACKTAAHEILHMYGLGHCVYRACLMNGTGHLKEDFAAPPYLCPVDLAKLQVALGAQCSLVPRYKALLAFCEAQRAGFDQHAHWIRRALAALGGVADASKVAMPSCAPAVAVGRKRPADTAAWDPPASLNDGVSGLGGEDGRQRQRR